MAERLLSGDRSALARLISWAENADPRYPSALKVLYPRVGQAWRIGITGPPGSGKSTLTDALLEELRAREETVGVLAIDPSSPFTGGALLGDRIRMEERTSDPGIFIRSMASRASHGGLARAAADAGDVMDAFGLSTIVMETVGVGQSEYDVVSAADTILVCLCPGAGDSIQAMKAGILEVADVLVVTKSDQPGADQLVLDLEDALRMRDLHQTGDDAKWTVPVVPSSAVQGEGIGDILAAVDAHRRHLESGDLAARRQSRRVDQVRRVVGERLEEELWGSGGHTSRVDTLLGKSIPPYDVAEEILRSILGRDPDADPGRSPGGQAR